MVKFTKTIKPSKGMNEMIVEDKNMEKACTFFVSDFHLEMILVPYINKKIENKEEVIIKTERSLKDTVEILMSKMNLKEENKKQILNLAWNKGDNIEIKEKSNVIIIGTEEYITETNDEIKKTKINDVNVIDCYKFEDVKEKMEEIVKDHNKSLNTMGFNKF